MAQLKFGCLPYSTTPNSSSWRMCLSTLTTLIEHTYACNAHKYIHYIIMTMTHHILYTYVQKEVCLQGVTQITKLDLIW